MFDKIAAFSTFELMETRVCFIGHSHIPGIYSNRNARVNDVYREKVKISEGEKIIVNVGSVGQSRDGDPRICYCVYDTDRGLVELKRRKYDIQKAQKKIIEAGLPPFLAYRLSKGS